MTHRKEYKKMIINKKLARIMHRDKRDKPFIAILFPYRSTSFNKLLFSMACPGKYNPWNVLKVTHQYYFGDWLFLYYIAKNLDNYVFKELLQRLAEDLENRHHARYKVLPPVEEGLLKKRWEDINPKSLNWGLEQLQ